MNFSGTLFLLGFLPLTLAVYYALPRSWKNPFLLIASLIFYLTGDIRHLPLLLISALFNYGVGLFLSGKYPKNLRKCLLILSVVGNLAILGIFKYTDFIFGSLNTIAGLTIPLPGLVLPVGISFYTFQAMSYTIDVYRGDVALQKNPLSFGLYLTLFPQLIAGPIVRYGDIAEEITGRVISADKLVSGINRFCVGLAKKVILANTFGQAVEIWRSAPEQSLLLAWMAAIGYSLQIYFDFSGYSDMAIGIGRMLGFTFPENFDHPYIAASITEFWRRWHKTLSGWFRDYVYIPLGGNRRGLPRQIVNLLIVWSLTGLWHGAAWNFLLWGFLYGVLLILEKLFLLKILKKAPVLGHIYTLFFVIIGFVLFGAADFAELRLWIAQLFGAGNVPLAGGYALFRLSDFAFFFLIGIVGATPLPVWLWKKLPEKASAILSPCLVLLCLISVLAFRVDGSFNPFLYFRF